MTFAFSVLRKTTLPALLLLLALILLPGKAMAQRDTTATLTGRVVDFSGSPIEHAAVAYILNGKSKGTYTDSAGFFKLTIPANKQVTIKIGFASYKSRDFLLKLSPGESRFKLLELEPAINGDTAVIHGDYETGYYVPVSALPYVPSASGDALAALKPILGLQSNNELSSQYSVRGGSFDENLVYVNGIEVYRPLLTRSGQEEGLSFVNGDMIDRIYFSAGGFEAKYGDKLASVLDITYRRPTKFRGSVSAGFLGGSVEVEGVGPEKRFTWMLGIRQKSNQYLLNNLDTRGDYTAVFTDMQTMLTYSMSDEWELNYLGNLAQNRYELVPETRETNFGTLNEAYKFTVYFDGQVLNRFRTGFNALSAKYDNHRNLTLRFTGSSFISQEEETFDVEGQYFIDQLETDFGKPTFGQVAFNRGVGGFLNHARNFLDAYVYNGEHQGKYIHQHGVLGWGIKYQHERIFDQLSEWNLTDSAGYLVPFYPLDEITMQEVIKGKAEIFSNRVMGFLQHTWSWEMRDTSRLTFNIGGRVNYWDLNGQVLFSPRANLVWKPYWKKDVSFKLAGGVYQQPPFYRELRDFAGNLNTNIKAQTSIHAVLGSDLHFKAWDRPFRFITEAFYKYLDNIIPYEINDVRLRYFGDNMAYGYTYGIDLKLNGEFVKGTESWVNLSVMRVRENLYNDYYNYYLNSDGDTIIPGYTVNNVPVDSITIYPGFIPRPTDQLVTFSMYFQDYLPMLPDCKMNLGLIFGTGLPFGPPNHQRYLATNRMPPYRRVDIGFSYEIIKEKKPLSKSNPFHVLKSLWVGAEVYNLLQVNNTVSYYWIKDVTSRMYGVPNYLTNRQIGLRLISRF